MSAALQNHSGDMPYNMTNRGEGTRQGWSGCVHAVCVCVCVCVCVVSLLASSATLTAQGHCTQSLTTLVAQVLTSGLGGPSPPPPSPHSVLFCFVGGVS